MWRGSGRRIAGIGSASAKTPTTGSEGEPGIASTARGSEPGYPIRRPRQTTAEPGPSPRRNGARKSASPEQRPPNGPLRLSKEVAAVACSRALPRRTRRTSPNAECSSSTIGAPSTPALLLHRSSVVESADCVPPYSCWSSNAGASASGGLAAASASEQQFRHAPRRVIDCLEYPTEQDDVVA
jgi:hypothetical protein